MEFDLNAVGTTETLDNLKQLWRGMCYDEGIR